MLERFTDRARKAMALANQEAVRFNHEYIGTEHILLGLAKEGTGVAAIALKNLDADLRTLRLQVEQLVHPGPAGSSPTAKLAQTPRAISVIRYAVEESENLGHNYVGTEHLLLGLLREPDGIAHRVLSHLGLSLDAAREQVLTLLGRGVDPAAALALPDSLEFHLSLPPDLAQRLYQTASTQSTTPADIIRQLLDQHLP